MQQTFAPSRNLVRAPRLAVALLILACLVPAIACGKDEKPAAGDTASAPVAGSGDAQAAATRIASAIAAGEAARNQAQGAQSGGDPCALLTLEEVRAANGAEMRPGRRNGRDCEFYNEDETRLVAVGVTRGAAAGEFNQLCAPENQGRIDVPGVGDRSCILSITASIFTLKGGAMLTVQLLGPSTLNGADLQTRMVELTKKALPRM